MARLDVPADFENSFYPIGIVAGSGPEAGVDLWSKVLLASRRIKGSAYKGDSDAPHVRIVSDPALGLPTNHQNDSIISTHLRRCVSDIAATCNIFSIACNALQARAKDQMSKDTLLSFVGFDVAVDDALSDLQLDTFFLLGASTIMSLENDSIYFSLKNKYSIKTPKNWAAVDALISDIKLTGGKDPNLVPRLESFVSESNNLPVVLACTDFPLVPISPRGTVTIDATEVLALSLARRAKRGKVGT